LGFLRYLGLKFAFYLKNPKNLNNPNNPNF